MTYHKILSLSVLDQSLPQTQFSGQRVKMHSNPSQSAKEAYEYGF